MTTNKSTRLEIIRCISSRIRCISDIIGEVDEERIRTGGTKDLDEKRLRLETDRDILNSYQRDLASKFFKDNTVKLQGHLDGLQQINNNVEATADKLKHIADTLNDTVRFIGEIQKIISLI